MIAIAMEPPAQDVWIPTEKTWPIFWILMAAIPVFLILILALMSVLGALVTLGPSGTLEAIIAGVLITALGELFFLNAFRTAAIQVRTDGLTLRRTLGRPHRIPWSSITISEARPVGYGVLRVNGSRGGFYTLSPRQFAAVRSSPLARQEPASPK